MFRTRGGGQAVQFTDIETLRQECPTVSRYAHWPTHQLLCRHFDRLCVALQTSGNFPNISRFPEILFSWFRILCLFPGIFQVVFLENFCNPIRNHLLLRWGHITSLSPLLEIIVGYVFSVGHSESWCEYFLFHEVVRGGHRETVRDNIMGTRWTGTTERTG